LRIARQSRVWSCAFSSAARPATCGAAIDVPLNVAYEPWRYVLSTDWPGAPMCTLRNP
jgi:hypothetical protein